MPVRPPLGESSFILLRQDGYTYVDKTAEVAAILDDPARVLLITRPRRFGKTLLLGTLAAFVERPELAGLDTGPLFAGTAIDADPVAARWRQRHPVLSLSLREVKPRDPGELRAALTAEVQRLLRQFAWLRDTVASDPIATAIWQQLSLAEPPLTVLQGALGNLSRWLHEATGERAVVLVDEYDTPLHAAWLGGFYEDAVGLVRPMLSGVLKDNPSLAKGVLTGVTRVARDSLFSGLNNLVVASLLDREHPACCGFTQEEVDGLLALAGLSDRREEVRAWYDGYRVADVVLYNPWSVLSFLRSPSSGFRAWWVATGGDELLRSLLITGAPGLQSGVEAVLRGEPVDQTIVEHTALRDLQDAPDTVWTLLVHAGYLQVSNLRQVGHRRVASLAPPNLEVREAWSTLFTAWMARSAGGEDGVQRLTDALLGGDQPTLQAELQRFAMRTLSYLDPAGRAPERVWHAFVLGLLAHLAPTHRVQSEAPAGTGRADVLVVPHRPGPGAVMEFKREQGESLEVALDAAMAQIDSRRYVDRLLEAGAAPRWKVAVAFSGQEVVVRVAGG